MPAAPISDFDNPSQVSKGILALACFVLQSGLLCASFWCFSNGGLWALLGFIPFLAAVAFGAVIITDVASQLQSDSPLLQILSSELPWWANLIYVILTVVACVISLPKELGAQESSPSSRLSSILPSSRATFWSSNSHKSS